MTFGVADWIIPNLSDDLLANRVALGLLGLFAVGSSLLERPIAFTPRAHQVRRRTAERRIIGVPLVGFLMGLGWWTNIPSGLMWLALILAALSGHGVSAGIAFGIGRAAAFWIGATVLSSRNDLERIVVTLLSVRWRGATRVVEGVVGAVMLIATTSQVIQP